MSGTYQTGFCSAGLHEGTRPKGFLTQTPMKVCEYWQDCSCPCHAELTRMFELGGQERIPVPNPEYVPPEHHFWMPSPEDKLPPPQADVASEEHLEVTATGRVRKGGLELAVQKVLLAWLETADMAKRIEGLVVKDIAAMVFENEGAALDKPPSLGAVGAVLDRWDSYGYVLLGQKPVRIIGLTPDGKDKGLDYCRARFKSKKVA